MDAASELERLTALCEKLGSPRRQAAIMAAQLQKRATQLATERGTSREEAMAGLLSILMDGSQGRAPAATDSSP